MKLERKNGDAVSRRFHVGFQLDIYIYIERNVGHREEDNKIEERIGGVEGRARRKDEWWEERERERERKSGRKSEETRRRECEGEGKNGDGEGERKEGGTFPPRHPPLEFNHTVFTAQYT